MLDEPVAGVDAANRAEIGQLLSELRQQGVPLLVVTHDIDEVRPFVFDQQWRLVDGRLLVEAPGSSQSGAARAGRPTAHAGAGAGGSASAGREAGVS